MRDVTALFREYARLDLMRLDQGLSLAEHERWSAIKGILDEKFGRSGKAPGGRTQRSAPRVETRLNCSYATGDDCREAIVSNLSTGGVFIRTAWPLPVDTRVKLQIHLEDSGRDIVVHGVVVSNNVAPDLDATVRGMGVRFAQVDDDVLEQLSALYSNEISRNIEAHNGSRAAG